MKNFTWQLVALGVFGLAAAGPAYAGPKEMANRLPHPLSDEAAEAAAE